MSRNDVLLSVHWVCMWREKGEGSEVGPSEYETGAYEGPAWKMKGTD
jgi:hypothetical protein